MNSSRAYYIYRCECTNPLTDGYYCEYKRHDSCSLTREEVARGDRWDEKCTDSQHGACVDISGVAHCVLVHLPACLLPSSPNFRCKPDYTGEKCEIFDPCARQPCKHGDCIPVGTSRPLKISEKISDTEHCRRGIRHKSLSMLMPIIRKVEPGKPSLHGN